MPLFKNIKKHLLTYLTSSLRHIVTAAHCVTSTSVPGQDWFEKLLVLFGAHRSIVIGNEKDPGSLVEEIEKKNIIVHENWHWNETV